MVDVIEDILVQRVVSLGQNFEGCIWLEEKISLGEDLLGCVCVEEVVNIVQDMVGGEWDLGGSLWVKELIGQGSLWQEAYGWRMQFVQWKISQVMCEGRERLVLERTWQEKIWYELYGCRCSYCLGGFVRNCMDRDCDQFWYTWQEEYGQKVQLVQGRI